MAVGPIVGSTSVDLASASPPHSCQCNDWRERFRVILSDFRFLPGGRILAAAGTERHTTLLNSFVMGPMEDSANGIFSALREAMVTLQAGGGVGVDFSTLQPLGALAQASSGVASGPVSFMAVWEAANSALASNNVRRGAMMVTLRCDHPDIEAFIEAKLVSGVLPHFKLSVALTDDFMHALETDSAWPLVFPLGQRPLPADGEVCERVTTTRPCGEVPLPALWRLQPGVDQPDPLCARAFWSTCQAGLDARHFDLNPRHGLPVVHRDRQEEGRFSRRRKNQIRRQSVRARAVARVARWHCRAWHSQQPPAGGGACRCHQPAGQ